MAKSLTIKRIKPNDGWSTLTRYLIERNLVSEIHPVSEMEIELPVEIEEIDRSEPSRAEVRKAVGHLKMEKRRVSTTHKQTSLKSKRS